MLTQRDSGGLWGAPLPELFAQYCVRQHEMGKVKCKGAETHLSPPHPPIWGRRTGLETCKLGRVGPESQLGWISTQLPKDRGGCVSSHPASPWPTLTDSFPRKSCRLQRKGWLGRGYKQKQHSLSCVPAHLSGASAEQFLGSSRTKKLGWAMARMTGIYESRMCMIGLNCGSL